MARIRSIHPGLFTDEAFMSLSPHARLLFIGIWTEAFDDGVFDWKPLTLKARVFPADNVDVPSLLAELVANQCIREEESNGHKVGLVRNFRRFQRPKKPNSSGLFKPEWETYVGSSGLSTELVPNQFSTSTEKSPQMEDVGGKRKEEVTSLRSVSVARVNEPPEEAGIPVMPVFLRRVTTPLDAIEDELRAAAGLENDPSPSLLNLSPMLALIDSGYDLARDILPKLREAKARGKHGKTWTYYVASITENKAANAAIPAKATTTPSAPVAWITEDDPRFADFAARYFDMTGKQIRKGGSKYENGIGAHFPADWVAPKSSVAA